MRTSAQYINQLYCAFITILKINNNNNTDRILN